MTVLKRQSLLCDHQGCIIRWRGLENEPLRSTRREARGAGWRYLPGHPALGIGRDLCPRHRNDPK